uniref:Uncharacterized protein n=1 Tax=Suricata suricatta TaxID=37032 RepID=A0A673UB10_SURSU
MPLRGPSDACFTTFLMSSYLAAFSRRQVRSTTDTLGVGTQKAMPVSFPFSSGMTLPTALAAPVEAGMMFWAAPRPSRHSFPEGPSTVFWGGGDGMDCGHESLHNAEVVMDDLGQRGQAVGGAGGIADNLERVIILLVVHAHHKHGGISRRDRDDDPLGPTLQVSPSLLHGGEDPSGLHNILSTSITPFDVGGISLLEDGGEDPPVDSTKYSAPASPHLMLVGSCSWKTMVDFPLMTSFL